MSESNYCVYMHTSPSGKSYIGITSRYEIRCYQHQHKSNPCRYFANAIKKYGWDNFQHIILHSNLTEQQAITLEQHEIKSRKTLEPDGYNLTEGGQGGALSESTKIKLRNIHKNPEFKKNRSDAIKQSLANPKVQEKISKGLKIANAKPEVKAKRSEASKITNSRPEVKAKIIEGLKKHHAQPEAKQKRKESQKIAQNNPETNKKRSESLIVALSKPGVKEKLSASSKAFQAKIRLEKQSLERKKAEEWNNSKLNTEKSFIPMLAESMQIELF